MKIPSLLPAPAVTACYRYTDIMNQAKFTAKFGYTINDSGSIIQNADIPKTGIPKVGIPKQRSLDDESIRFVQSMLSVRDIFALTPPTDDAIQACKLRTPASFTITEIDSKNPENKNDADSCLSYFNVTKFFLLEYICYRYIYKGKDASTLFTFDELANSPAGPGTIYEITPGDAFSQYMITKMISHEASTYPYEATAFSPVMDRDDGTVKLDAKSGGTVEELNPAANFILTYFSLKEQRLEPPFETNCFDYSAIKNPVTESKIDCHQMCVMNATIDAYDRVPFSSIIVRPFEQRVLSYNDLQNKTMLDQLLAIHKRCNEICEKPDCIASTTFTKIRTRMNDKLTVRMTVSDAPSFDINYKPIMRTIEYLIYIMSTLGVWFGVSIHGVVNPIKIDAMKWIGDRIKKLSKLGQLSSQTVNRDARHSARKKLTPVEQYCIKRMLALERRMTDMRSEFLSPRFSNATSPLKTFNH